MFAKHFVLVALIIAITVGVDQKAEAGFYGSGGWRLFSPNLRATVTDVYTCFKGVGVPTDDYMILTVTNIGLGDSGGFWVRVEGQGHDSWRFVEGLSAGQSITLTFATYPRILVEGHRCRDYGSKTAYYIRSIWVDYFDAVSESDEYDNNFWFFSPCLREEHCHNGEPV